MDRRKTREVAQFRSMNGGYPVHAPESFKEVFSMKIKRIGEIIALLTAVLFLIAAISSNLI